jgi:hypothetical protein
MKTGISFSFSRFSSLQSTGLKSMLYILIRLPLDVLYKMVLDILSMNTFETLIFDYDGEVQPLL